MNRVDGQFRNDIQGLRAISILAVIGYHYGVPGFGGGYVGVDIFFVISGFLITGLLLKEMERRGSLDLTAFWARRARRLLPNALLTLAATLAAMLVLAPVTEQLAIAHDIASAALYVANYRLADRAVDYFDHAVAASPVLHFWSLSIEEQFYVLWPLLLIGLLRLPGGARPSRIALLLAALIAISFAAMMLWLRKSQPAAFFHSESRFWQLAAGALLAALARMRGPQPAPAWVRDLLAWLGLAGIAASISLFDDSLSYPGLLSLLPVVSAAALIWGSRVAPSSPGPLLGIAPMRAVGDRSYSLYLWHWPPLVLAAHLVGDGFAGKFVLLAVSVALALLAYTLVEVPMRFRFWQGLAPRSAVAGALAACGLLAVASVSTSRLDMVHGATLEMVEKVRTAKSDGAAMARFCRPPRDEDANTPTSCVYGDANGKRTVVLFGDSHAAHLFDGVNEAARNTGWALKAWVRAQCPPNSAVAYNTGKRTKNTGCIAWRNEVLARLVANPPDLLILSSTIENARELFAEDGARYDHAQSRARWSAGFEEVLTRLTAAGVRTVVVRDVPRSRQDDVLECLASRGELACGTARNSAIDPNSPDVEVARRFPDVRILDLTDEFCGANVCPAIQNGVIVYRDNIHITGSFSRTLAPAFERLLRDYEPRTSGGSN